MNKLLDFKYFQLCHARFKIPWKSLSVMISFFLITTWFLLWNVRIDSSVKISLFSKDNHLYQAVLSPSLVEFLRKGNELIYQNRTVSYTVDSIESDGVIQNGNWYLAVWIKIDEISSLPNQIVEVTLVTEKKTIFQYFYDQFRKE